MPNLDVTIAEADLLRDLLIQTNGTTSEAKIKVGVLLGKIEAVYPPEAEKVSVATIKPNKQ